MASIFEDHGIDKCPDFDGDGYDNHLCGGTDCNDVNSNIYPGALESCNGLDDDCNGQIDEIDEDEDGYGPISCGGSDCNDNNPNINPGQAEDCNNGLDDDCDQATDASDPDCAPECSCTEWQDQACNQGSCAPDQMLQTRTCTPSACEIEQRCISHEDCGTCDYTSYTSCQSAYEMQVSENVTAVVRQHLCGDEQFFKVTTTGICDIHWSVKTFEIVYYNISVKWDGSCPSLIDYDCFNSTTEASRMAICKAQDLPPGTYYMTAHKDSGTGYYSAYVEIDCQPPCEPEPEICDGLDNNCNGQIDENLYQACGSGLCSGTKQCSNGVWSSCSSSGQDAGTCALCGQDGNPLYDGSQDGDCSPTLCPSDACGLGGCGLNIFADFPYSVPNECSSLHTCTNNACTAVCEADSDSDSYSPTCGDCNDNNNTIHPGAQEICDDGLDNNCNSHIDEGCMGSISGTIMESDGTASIQGAYISCTEQTKYMYAGGTHSLSNGSYFIDGLETGIYYARASYPGMAPAVMLDLEVIKRFNTGNIDFNLSNITGSISGRVTNSTGSPLPGVWVSAGQSRDPDSTEDEETYYINGNSTNSEGYYYIGDLAPRSAYKVGVYSPSYNGIYYAKASQHNIDVLAGQDHSVNFSLERAVWISGRLTDALTGDPVADARVYMSVNTFQMGGSASTNESGDYAMKHLPPGIYIAEITAEGYGGILKLINASSDIYGLDFALGTGALVTGRVTDSLGSPMMGMRVYAEWNRYLEAYGETVTDLNGSYTLYLLQGNYSIHVYDSSYDYVPALSQHIEVGNENISGIDFVVSGAGSISGNITDHTGGLVDNLEVLAFEAGTQFDIGHIDHIAPVSGAPADSMEYTLDPLPLGEYDLGLIVYQDFIEGGMTVTAPDLIEGANLSGESNLTDMNFDIQSAGGTLMGMVTGSGPVYWATLVVTDMLDDFVSYALSNIDGSYIMNHIPEGDYTIWAKKMNYSVFSQVFSISEGENKTLNIDLAQGPSVPGDVNGDCAVNIFDLAKVGLCYGCQEGESCWDSCSQADIHPPEGDCIINIFDLAAVGLNYGSTC